MERVLVARVVEAGFAVPAEASLSEWTSEKYRLLSVPGLQQQLQYFKVVLTSTDSAGTSAVLVISAHHPRLSEADLRRSAAALATHAKQEALVFLRQDRAGWSNASCSDDTDDELAAAAVAAVKVICGWDESSRIVVEVGQRELEVMPERRNDQWLMVVKARG